MELFSLLLNIVHNMTKLCSDFDPFHVLIPRFDGIES